MTTQIHLCCEALRKIREFLCIISSVAPLVISGRFRGLMIPDQSSCTPSRSRALRQSTNWHRGPDWTELAHQRNPDLKSLRKRSCSLQVQDFSRDEGPGGIRAHDPATPRGSADDANRHRKRIAICSERQSPFLPIDYPHPQPSQSAPPKEWYSVGVERIYLLMRLSSWGAEPTGHRNGNCYPLPCGKGSRLVVRRPGLVPSIRGCSGSSGERVQSIRWFRPETDTLSWGAPSSSGHSCRINSGRRWTPVWVP